MKVNHLITFALMTSLGLGTILLFDKEEESTKPQILTGIVSETSLNLKEMTDSINNLGFYKVFDGTVPVKHKHTIKIEHKVKDMFEEGSFFGADEEITIAGSADCYYEYIINLSEAIIEQKGDKIVFTCNKAFLNEKTIKRSSKTVLDKDLSSKNFGANMSLGNSEQIAMTEWEDSFEEEAYDKLIDSEDTYKIDINTKSAIRLLMEKFGVEEEDLVVVIK